MFAYTELTLIQLLLGTTLLGTLLALVLTAYLPISRIWKLTIAIIVVIMSFLAYHATDEVLGLPKPISNMVEGVVEGNSTFSRGDEDFIAILIQRRGELPLTVSVPWTEELAKNLREAAKNREQGLTTGIRIKTQEPNNMITGIAKSPSIEFYDFAQMELPAK